MINFPETILEHDGEQKMLYTNKATGCVEVKRLERDGYIEEMKRTIQSEIEKLRKFPTKYKKQYDFEENLYAPVIITKQGEDYEPKFEVNIESYKNFTEWKSRLNSGKLVQRFIWPRNMRAMIVRLCFNKEKRKEQKEEYFGYRFQNVDDLLRQNKKHPEIWETVTLQAMINVMRENKVELTKITNINGLKKFIVPASNLMSFI